MGSIRGRRTQTLFRIGRVLLLTISLGIAVLAIMDTPITPPFTLHPQAQPMVAKGSTSNNDEGVIEWNQTYGGPHHEEGKWVEQTTDGGYIITGYTYSYGVGEADMWLIKTDSTGHVVWNQTYGGLGYDEGKCVEQTTDGGYIITGTTVSYGLNYVSWDAWLIKTDAVGHVVWNQTYGGPFKEVGNWVEQTTDGGYIITGYTGSYGAGIRDLWLIKTDSTGHAMWTQTYGGPNKDWGSCVKQTTDGGYIITGSTESYGAGEPDVWLIKTDSTGYAVWTQAYTYSGPTWDGGSCVEQTTDSGYIITGYTVSYGAGDADVWLIKTDAAGTVMWNQTYGGTGNDWGFCVAQTANGGYIITGTTASYGAGDADVWLIKTDTYGHAVWNQTYGGTGYEESFCVAQTANGGYIITGTTASYGAGKKDILVITVPPLVIDHPEDIVYEEGSTGHQITWHPRDSGGCRIFNPHMFNVTRDGTLVDDGIWDGGDITVNVDGLAVGTSIFTCGVNDTLGNSVSDSVSVTVTSPEVSEVPCGTVFFILAVIGVVLVWRGVFVKLKR